MDQIIVHSSINHATLPRIKAFLSHLQIGPMSVRITAVQTYRSISNEQQARQTTVVQPNGSKQNEAAFGRPSYQVWRALTNILWGRLSRAPSISEQPLKHPHELGIELSTTVWAGNSALSRSDGDDGQPAAAPLPSEVLNRGENSARFWGVTVRSDIDVTYELA